MRSDLRAMAAGACVLAACMAGGCASGGDRARTPDAGAKREPVAAPRAPVDYRTAAKAYNVRVARLEKLWAAATVSIIYIDDRGERQREQGEGHLQLVRPGKLSLTVGKLGDPYFVLGSDGERFWWMDLREPKVAWVGDVRDEDEAQRLGVPVAPAELMELLAVTPLPLERMSGGKAVPAGGTQWSADGRELGIIVPRRAAGGGGVRGAIRIWVDPLTYAARRVEILDARMTPLMVSRLSEYEGVLVKGGDTSLGAGGAETRIATLMEADILETDTQVRLLLGRPENSPNRPRPDGGTFILRTLLEAYGVRDVRTVGEDRAAPAEEPGR